MFDQTKSPKKLLVRMRIVLIEFISGFQKMKNKKFLKHKLRRASPFVEEVGLVLIALFFFVILYSVFSEIIDSFINIIDDILQNLSL